MDPGLLQPPPIPRQLMSDNKSLPFSWKSPKLWGFVLVVTGALGLTFGPRGCPSADLDVDVAVEVVEEGSADSEGSADASEEADAEDAPSVEIRILTPEEAEEFEGSGESEGSGEEEGSG